ncbi:uncharacterized protein [Miscanthus floridulus]|uniref:uncharacterized protein n=1 Tax=Miscanthus floridulus TaxID=154761 RepID=UPI0034578D93
MTSNYHVKHINFYVADFNTAYHAILESLALAEATDLSIQMANVVTDAKTVPADDLEIPSLEPPRASTKSKETKEADTAFEQLKLFLVMLLAHDKHVVAAAGTEADAAAVAQDALEEEAVMDADVVVLVLVVAVAVAVALVAQDNLGNEVAMGPDALAPAGAPAQNNLGNEVAMGVDALAATVAAMAMVMAMTMAALVAQDNLGNEVAMGPDALAPAGAPAQNNLGNEVAMGADASAAAGALAQNNLGNEVAIGVDVSAATVAAMAMAMAMVMAATAAVPVDVSAAQSTQEASEALAATE